MCSCNICTLKTFTFRCKWSEWTIYTVIVTIRENRPFIFFPSLLKYVQGSQYTKVPQSIVFVRIVR